MDFYPIPGGFHIFGHRPIDISMSQKPPGILKDWRFEQNMDHPNVTWNSKNEVWEDDFPAGFVFLLIGSNFHVKFLDRIKFEKELILEGVRFLEVAQNSPE